MELRSAYRDSKAGLAGESPARLYALLVGALLLILGIVGFFYESTFTSDQGVRDSVFGILDVNGWHNLVHVLTGFLGLLAFGAGAYAVRNYALGLGIVLIGMAIWGFAVGDGGSILGIIPVNTEDNVLHAILGVVGLLAAFATEKVTAAPPSPVAS